MITASQLAGFCAAHAIWSVSDGATLIPILGYTIVNDERKLERLALRDLGAAVALGKKKLASNEMDANDAVLLYDSFITIEDQKRDAIILEMRAYFSPHSEAVMAIPYTHKSAGKFLVQKPVLITWKDCEDFNMEAAFEAFFDGVDSHEKGAAVWEAAFDEST
jgi:hypothetical protein